MLAILVDILRVGGALSIPVADCDHLHITILKHITIIHISVSVWVIETLDMSRILNMLVPVSIYTREGEGEKKIEVMCVRGER